MLKYIVVLLLLCVQTGYSGEITSGPMVGYCSMREASVWVQTSIPSDVIMEYSSESEPQKKLRTEIIHTINENMCAATLIADKVEPGTKYNYTIFVNKKKANFSYPTSFQTPPLWQWRTTPPDFSVAMGSCVYVNETEYDRPGNGYGSDYEIFASIHRQKPDIMLWLGDNTYLREADWNSRNGIFKRYTHTRSLPEMQPLLASTGNYAIWDDHDFGPNDSDKGFAYKNHTYEAFKTFWANPSYGFDGKDCITTSFEWGDVQFFLLDNRSFRTPNNRKTGKNELLGEEQIDWLINNLVSSKARFKVIAIGGQTINNAAVFENYATRADERKKLLDLIEAEHIKGVFFLSGDRHFTELSKLERPNTYPLYDLTCSALTSGVNKKALEEKNDTRVEGTVIMEHNFAMLRFTGKDNERVMIVTVYSVNGTVLWEKKIFAKDIQ